MRRLALGDDGNGTLHVAGLYVHRFPGESLCQTPAFLAQFVDGVFRHGTTAETKGEVAVIPSGDSVPLLQPAGQFEPTGEL